MGGLMMVMVVLMVVSLALGCRRGVDDGGGGSRSGGEVSGARRRRDGRAEEALVDSVGVEGAGHVEARREGHDGASLARTRCEDWNAAGSSMWDSATGCGLETRALGLLRAGETHGHGLE